MAKVRLVNILRVTSLSNKTINIIIKAHLDGVRIMNFKGGLNTTKNKISLRNVFIFSQKNNKRISVYF